MSFFDSEVVRAEMTEIGELQDEVYTSVFKFPSMSQKEKVRHVDLLEKLLDKQKVLYTRLSLSDDQEEIEMKQGILDSAKMMGLQSNVIMSVIFKNMSDMLGIMKQQIDSTETDL